MVKMWICRSFLWNVLFCGEGSRFKINPPYISGESICGRIFWGGEVKTFFPLGGGTSKNFPFVACFILTSEKSQTIFKLWKMSKLFSPAAGSHSRRNKKYWVQPQVFPLIKLKLLKNKKKSVGPYYMFIPAFCFTVWLDSLHRNP